jgi:iron complex transport system substrate-binding protein
LVFERNTSCQWYEIDFRNSGSNRLIVKMIRAICIGFLMLIATMAFAAISVVDDDGNTIRLPAAAQRIISLAPNVTELLFVIDAGERLVGTVEHSDYPAAAQRIRRVGGYNALDLEIILTLQPDLIIGWRTGNNPVQLEKLQALGLPVFISEPRQLQDIPNTAKRLAALTGTSRQAKVFIQQFEQQYASLQQRYAKRQPVKLFYEVWHQPLMTINGEHLISDLIQLCGAVNIFADVPVLAPTVSIEAVISAAPDIIVTGGHHTERNEWRAAWQRWPQLPAVVHDQLYFINPDLMQRHGPRILQGAEQLCQYVEQARQKKYAREKSLSLP